MADRTVDADVIILGGGPAGCAAAITAAVAGLSVVLIEREGFPRPAPGESAHPGVQALFRQLGVEEAVLSAGFLRHPGHVVLRSGGETFVPFGQDDDGPWLGFQLWRPTFDSILLDRTKALGVRVIQPSQAIYPILREERLCGVQSSAGPFTAKIIIDATGRWRQVTRWLGIPWKQNGPTRTAWYGYVQGHYPDRDEFPLLSINSQGWTWIARVRPNIYAWSHHNFRNARPATEWFSEERCGLEPISPTLGADVTWSVASAVAGDGYFLVGDAAFIIDPASGHGILKALMSGIQAGFLVSQIVQERVIAAQAIQHYSKWMNEWFEHDVSNMKKLYEFDSKR